MRSPRISNSLQQQPHDVSNVNWFQCRGRDAVNSGTQWHDPNGCCRDAVAQHSRPTIDIEATVHAFFLYRLSPTLHKQHNRPHFTQSWHLKNSKDGLVSTSLRPRATCNGASLSRRSGRKMMLISKFLIVASVEVTCTCSPLAGVRRLIVSRRTPPRPFSR